MHIDIEVQLKNALAPHDTGSRRQLAGVNRTAVLVAEIPCTCACVFSLSKSLVQVEVPCMQEPPPSINGVV